eukprot:g26791.t1
MLASEAQERRNVLMAAQSSFHEASQLLERAQTALKEGERGEEELPKALRRVVVANQLGITQLLRLDDQEILDLMLTPCRVSRSRTAFARVLRAASRRCCVTSVTEIEHRDDGAFKRYVPGPKTGGFARGSFIAWRRHERVRDEEGNRLLRTDSIRELYDFAEVVGEGGFGTVLRARHRRTGEVVAIKSIAKSQLKDEEALQLEVAFLKMSDHPNTVRYYETFEDAHDIHLVMEMCSGGSLAQYIQNAHEDFGPGVSEDELARITLQMLQGIAYWVLRNDRPEKRLLTKCAGTVGYMAPEVFGSRPYDGRSADLFSIGAVMHHMIVGVPPSWKSATNTYEFPGKVRYMQLSEDCQSLMEHLLHEEPEMRPTAAEALQHPWFDRGGFHNPRHGPVESMADLLERCFRRMHDFCQRTQLQKTIMYSMVAFAGLHNHHMEELRTAFLVADRGKSAGVSCFEFVELGRKYSRFTSKELRKMFAAANVSRNGKLSYCEWLAAGAPADWYSQQCHAERAFDTLDVQRNGYIRAEDLCQLLPKVLDQDEIEREILCSFPDEDGRLCFKDFVKCSAELLELLQDPGATEGQKIQVLEMLKNMLELMFARGQEEEGLRSHGESKSRRAAVWCDLRRKEHADMEVKMQEETKSIQSASKLLLAGTGLVAFQPSQSEPLVTFMQVLQRHRSIRERKSNARALRGKASPLNKITKLVDSMTQVLQKDQEDDDLKIQMCKD